MKKNIKIKLSSILLAGVTTSFVATSCGATPPAVQYTSKEQQAWNDIITSGLKMTNKTSFSPKDDTTINVGVPIISGKTTQEIIVTPVIAGNPKAFDSLVAKISANSSLSYSQFISKGNHVIVGFSEAVFKTTPSVGMQIYATPDYGTSSVWVVFLNQDGIAIYRLESIVRVCFNITITA